MFGFNEKGPVNDRCDLSRCILKFDIPLYDNFHA